MGSYRDDNFYLEYCKLPESMGSYGVDSLYKEYDRTTGIYGELYSFHFLLRMQLN
jgi:hypothetical protein